MVSTDATCEPQPGPKEDSTLAGPKRRHLLDIVFLQDATGSQGPYIQACKAAITDICQKISEHMGSPGATTPADSSIRFGLIAFRDHPPQDSSFVTKNFGFTSSVPDMKKWLGGLMASGGGDGPEASTAAMAEALNLEWRQSDEDEEGKAGPKVVKIVVLVTDAPPHGLGEGGDGFPNGSPDQNDPLDIARQMAEHGISLYVIACEPGLSRYQHAVDFYRALTQITSGRMVPLLNASQLGDYIIGSALETLETEDLISQFQNTILEDVYGQGKSVEEVIERVQKELEKKQVQMNTLQVDEVYEEDKDAEANIGVWKSAGKLGEARGKVQTVSGPRLKAEYMPAPSAPSRSYASTPCGAMRAERESFDSPVRSPSFGSTVRSSSSSFSPLPPPYPSGALAPAPTGGLSRTLEGVGSEFESESESPMLKARGGAALSFRFLSRKPGKAPMPYSPSMPVSGSAPTASASPAPAPEALFESYEPTGLHGEASREKKVPKVQVVQQAVSLDQTRRLVMQGLSRHAKVGPGGKLTPKGVWANKVETGNEEKESGADGGPSAEK